MEGGKRGALHVECSLTCVLHRLKPVLVDGAAHLFGNCECTEWLRGRGKVVSDERMHGAALFCGPGLNPFRASFGLCAMIGWHVIPVHRLTAPFVAAWMTGDHLALVQNLDNGVG